MKRFVSYLYSIYNNQKIHNAGFARIELRTGRNRVDIHLKENGYSGKTGTVYLFIRKQKIIQGISIGNITFRNNQADFHYEQAEEKIGQTPWQIMQMHGILIMMDDRAAFLSQWDEEPVDTSQFEVWNVDKLEKKSLEIENPINKNPINKNPINKNTINKNTINKNPMNKNSMNESPMNKNTINENPANENPANENLANENLANESLANENLANKNPEQKAVNRSKATIKEKMQQNMENKKREEYSPAEENRKEAQIRQAANVNRGNAQRQMNHNTGNRYRQQRQNEKRMMSSARGNQKNTGYADNLAQDDAFSPEKNLSAEDQRHKHPEITNFAKNQPQQPENNRIPQREAMRSENSQKQPPQNSSTEQAGNSQIQHRQNGRTEQAGDSQKQPPENKTLDSSSAAQSGYSGTAASRVVQTENMQGVSNQMNLENRNTQSDRVMRNSLTDAQQIEQIAQQPDLGKQMNQENTAYHTNEYNQLKESNEISNEINPQDHTSNIQTAELQPRLESSWEQNWRYMLRMYPVLNQFTDKNNVLCVRIEIKDVRLLPEKYWSMINNSFLLHGFFNYRYLIFGRIEQNWFIGVPGIYQNQEHVMASIFGFPDFLPQSQKNERGEQPGYWYRILDI